MLDSAKFAAEFKALAERDTPSTNPNWVDEGGLGFSGSVSSINKSGIGNWSPFRELSELFLAEFTDAAARAGIALGAPNGVNPCDYFLDCLYNELIATGVRLTQCLNRGNEFGQIVRVCEAAAIFSLRHKTGSVKHRLAEQLEIAGSRAGPDVHVAAWGPFYSGGILLFRNEGTEAAKNVRLHCSTESGWRPILRPQVIASIPPGGHFRAIDVSAFGESQDEWEGGQSIAEFVDLLPTRGLTMKLVFEDQFGEEYARDVRASVSGGAHLRATFFMEGPATSTAPKPPAEEPVPPPPQANYAQPQGIAEGALKKLVGQAIRQTARETIGHDGLAEQERSRATTLIKIHRRDIVRKFRRDRQLSMADLARRCRTNSTAIYGMINGDDTRYGPDNRDRFLKGIGVSPEQWAGNKGGDAGQTSPPISGS